MTTRTRPKFADPRVGDLAFWRASPEAREETIFAPLRATQPVSWHPPAEGTMPVLNPDEDGFWAITGYAEIGAVSKDPETFCSGKGMMYEDFPPRRTKRWLRCWPSTRRGTSRSAA